MSALDGLISWMHTMNRRINDIDESTITRLRRNEERITKLEKAMESAPPPEVPERAADRDWEADCLHLEWLLGMINSYSLLSGSHFQGLWDAYKKDRGI